MGRSAKSGKANVEAKPRKSRKSDGSRVHDLEKRLTEALEQQTATADILRVISASPTDLQPVLDTVVKSAARFCGAEDATLFQLTGGHMWATAHHGPLPVNVGLPMPCVPGTVNGRTVLERRVIHVTDLQAEAEQFPEESAFAKRLGHRTVLGVPLLREGVAFGTIQLRRTEVRPFEDRQVALLQTFAAQAVIAIENVRLFNETKEALDRQTATAEILRVIASSTTELQPVLDAIAKNAALVCDAYDAVVFLREGDRVRYAAHYGPINITLERTTLSRGSMTEAAILDRQPVHVHDVLAAESPAFPLSAKAAREGGFRTALSVPLLRENEAVGALAIRRREVQPFTTQQIELLKTFADQAVIAIENVRLFTELQEKNRALTQAHAQVSEALEQQTATSEILRVISRAPTDTQPVFKAIVRSAVSLCDGMFSAVLLFDGRQIELVAHHNFSPEMLAAMQRQFPRAATADTLTGRAILERRVIHVRDPETNPDVPESSREVARVFGYRAIVSVPMLREGHCIGAINVSRPRAAFTDKQIALLETFADQAVIAIENVRLFKELEERTDELTRSVERLTALGEISQAVSSTLDLERVLDTITERARQLAGADGGAIYEYDEGTEQFLLRATRNVDASLIQALRATPLRKGEGVMGRATETREPIQIGDIAAPGVYESHLRDVLIGAGYRALLSVPIVREGQIIGSLSLNRQAPGEFPPEVIDVLKTFATQSALAIQNARLFRELADTSRQLEAASQHKSEFLANMSHELRTPLNAIIGFSEVLSERMFGELNEKQEEYLKDIHVSGQHLLSLINDILDLSKIEAGRMELELTDFDLPTAIDNALTLVRERAGRRGIALHQAVDEQLGQIRGDERKIKQVLLNLLSNALKFTPEGGRIDVRARLVDEMAQISVADTGVGIAPEDQDAIFEEFRQVGTAAKKVEGTGLGLALSRKFIELHGGRIFVQSQMGVGSTFTFTIPIRS